MVAVEVGQVVMIQTSGRRGATAQRGTVAKVGRVWADIEVPGTYGPFTYWGRPGERADPA